jgi:hypothetical protein
MWAREALGCCQQSLMADSGGSLEDQNVIIIVMRTVKSALMMFQIGRRTLLGIGLEVTCVTLQQGTCLYFVHALRLFGRQGDRLVNLTEVILRLPCIQAVSGCQVIAGCFYRVYSENWEQRTVQKDLKNLQFGQQKKRVFSFGQGEHDC